MMARMSPAVGLGVLVLITVIWGSTFVIVKDALDTIPASLLLAVRFTLASLALSAAVTVVLLLVLGVL